VIDSLFVEKIEWLTFAVFFKKIAVAGGIIIDIGFGGMYRRPTFMPNPGADDNNNLFIRIGFCAVDIAADWKI